MAAPTRKSCARNSLGLDAKFLHLCDLTRMSTAALTFYDSVYNQMTNY